jgi:O-antigen ligase
LVSSEGQLVRTADYVGLPGDLHGVYRSIVRLEVMVWGGGAQQNSTDARRFQYEAGLRLVAKNPIGHGIGEAAQTLGYIAPGADMLTIDTYYLAVALEFGVVGFVVYYAMLVFGIWHAGRTAIMTRDPELAFMGAACIAMVNFLISKSVFSQTENHPLMFIMLGLIVAAVYRERALAPMPAKPAAKERGRRAVGVFHGPTVGAA